MSKLKRLRRASRCPMFSIQSLQMLYHHRTAIARNQPTSSHSSISDSVIVVIPILRNIGFRWKLHITHLRYLQQLSLNQLMDKWKRIRLIYDGHDVSCPYSIRGKWEL